MRLYLPATLSDLAKGRESSEFGGPGALAHAVTPAVREWYTSGDQEELEYSVLTDAAESSLRLLAREASRPPRRVVVVAEVEDGAARSAHDAPSRSAVVLDQAIPLTQVACFYLDEPEAEPVVAAALLALDAADAGDEDARFSLDEAQAHDLLWYDVSELPHIC